MNDTVIKGTGNSRSIRSVPNLAALAPTYADLLALLTGEGLPVDIGALNELGLEVHGTDLTKANLLTDATAALYGKGTTATPNEILAAIRALITEAKNSVRLESGSYVGNDEKTKTLSFQFPPELIFISSYRVGTKYPYLMILEKSSPYFALFMLSTSLGAMNYYAGGWGTASISIQTAENNQYPFFNATGQTYYYHAIG